jgi:signal peptidase I
MADNTFIYKPALPKTGSIFIDIAQTIVIALAITVVIYLFIATPHQVDGRSMENNFHHNDLLLANKIIQMIGHTSIGQKLNYDYKRGDVIIFQQAGKPDYIKRIVATGGDTIMIKDNKVIVNDMVLDENYIPNTPEFKTELPNKEIAFLVEGQKKTVPENKYFVMGDNREHSQDSRFNSVGWVDRSEMKGKVFVRYWPLSSFGLISRGSYEETPYYESTNE